MSWLSDFLSALKPSSREEHFWAKIAGEEELENEYIPSSREEGFLYKIAQKIQGMIPAVGTNDKGKYLKTNDSTGALEWAEGGGGGGVWLEATMDGLTGALIVDMPWDDVAEAMSNGAIGLVRYMELGSSWILLRYYFQAAMNRAGEKQIVAVQADGTTIYGYAGTASEDGKTVFQPAS